MSLGDTITEDTAIHRVTNLDLAAFLGSVGVPLRKDPPYTVTRLVSGELRYVFNFGPRTADRKMKTSELIRIFIQSDKYIAEHPNDLLTGALCALRSRAKMNDYVFVKTKPWIAFRSPTNKKAIVHCIEGTKDHAMYARRGWKQCDTFEDEKRKAKYGQQL